MDSVNLFFNTKHTSSEVCFGAGYGNRTRVFSLGSWHTTTVRIPQGKTSRIGELLALRSEIRSTWDLPTSHELSSLQSGASHSILNVLHSIWRVQYPFVLITSLLTTTSQDKRGERIMRTQDLQDEFKTMNPFTDIRLWIFGSLFLLAIGIIAFYVSKD